MSRSSSIADRVARLLGAVLLLSLVSQAEIRMEPVPLTLQTLAVVLTGFVLGALHGFVATIIWLLAGASGLPLFAGGEGGISSFAGPTGGYLVAFPLAAALAGWLVERTPRASLVRMILAALAAHAVILTLGGVWLSLHTGPAAALQRGVFPFLPGAAIKSVAAAFIFALTRTIYRERGRGRA